MWASREAAFEISMTKGPMVITDISVPLDKIGSFLDAMAGRLEETAPGAAPFVVAHLGDGNIHYGIWLDPERKGINKGKADLLMQQVEQLTHDLNGSFSAEHGVGIYKLPSMARNKDPVALAVMRQIKTALDPQNILNPGKVIPA